MRHGIMKKQQNVKCPNCGSFNRLPIHWGLLRNPDPGDPETFFPGGCIVTENDPKWHCKDCGHKWGRPLGDGK